MVAHDGYVGRYYSLQRNKIHHILQVVDEGVGPSRVRYCRYDAALEALFAIRGQAKSQVGSHMCGPARALQELVQ